MKLIHHKELISVNPTPLFSITTENDYKEKNSHGHTESFSENKTHHRIYQADDRRIILHSADSKETPSLKVFFSLKQSIFPFSFFKDKSFIDFAIHSGISTSPLNYIVQEDSANTLFIQVKNNGIRILSDMEIASSLHLDLPNGEQKKVYVLAGKEKLAVVTDLEVESGYQTHFINLSDVRHIPFTGLKTTEESDESVKKLLNHVGINILADEEMTQHTIDLHISNRDVSKTPVSIKATVNKNTQLKVNIYGEIFHESSHKLSDLDGAADPNTNLKLIWIKSKYTKTIGVIRFDEVGGELSYQSYQAINYFQNWHPSRKANLILNPQNSHVNSFEKGVAIDLEHIAKLFNIKDLSTYIGWLQPLDEDATYTEVNGLHVYGEHKASFEKNKNTRYEVFEQLDELFVLLVNNDTKEVKQVPVPSMYQTLNNMSLFGGEPAESAKKVIDLLVEHWYLID